MSMFPSQLLDCTRLVTSPPLRPGQVEPSLPPTRAIFQPLCRKTKFTTDAAGSLLGQEDAMVGEADFCQGHPAQIWWMVIPGPGTLLVVHYVENFADMTHFDVLEGETETENNNRLNVKAETLSFPGRICRRLHGPFRERKINIPWR